LIRPDQTEARAIGGRTGALLLTCLLLFCAASSAQAEDCSDYPGGVLDGFAGTIAPSQLNIDQNCTIRNYPGGMSTNFSFFTQPGQEDERWLVIFDNVVHTGQMSCNAVQGHKIWFVNGSSSGIHANCQNLLIPVEKIDKQNPAGQTTAAIGVPFTYRLVIPVLFDPATGTVIDWEGSPNDLHGITVWDDLNATGVDLTYLGHTAYWLGSGAPVPHTFSNAGGALTFDLFPIVPAGDQFVIEITVVLEDTPTNAVGTSFVNTAKWDFGRLIDGVFYEPLPGEWGISPPLTIAAPALVMTKTGPATLGRTLNLGEWGTFSLDVQNTGLTDAWGVTLLDRLPDGATGGTCDQTPEVLGVTLAGSALLPGTHYSLSYAGAPTCELTLTLVDAAGPLGPGEHLVVDYRTKLDADSQDGVALTNVAGATEWFNDDSGNANRIAFPRTLTDGTVGVLDHEDAHTVTVALHGYFFEKTVANLTTGANPTATAAPGDRLRYTLRLQSTDVPLDDLAFQDDLGELNASAVFVPGSLALVSIPPGADASNTNPSGGTNGAGILDVRNLDVPANSEVRVLFDITLDPSLADGTVVLNQSELMSAGVKIADSDDPNIDGQADPDVVGDEDPTRVLILTAPPEALVKANTQATATIGVPFSYRITVPASPYPFAMYDVRILDDLAASSADLRFVSVSKVSGSGPWTPVNTGSATNLVIEDPTIGVDIPAGEQVVVEITLVLEDTPGNTAGLSFTNTADYTFDWIDADAASRRPGAPGTSPPMTIVEPGLTLEKSGPAQMTVGTPETFTLDVHNPTTTPAWNLTLTDRLPDGASGGMCDAAPSQVSAQLFLSGGAPSTTLVPGSDFAVGFSGPPACTLTLTILSAAGTIGPDQRLVVSYQTELDADTQNGVALTNVAGATEWFSADAGASGRRTYTRSLTDGTVGTLDHEDAHTVFGITNVPSLFAAKDVEILVDLGTPTAVDPGDVLRYTITVTNNGGVAATGVTLTDGVPANTTYVADSVTLNGLPVGQPDLGVFPLAAGIPISSADQTPPLPGPGGGTISSGRSAVVNFDLRVNDGVPGGTVISNQAVVASQGLPDLPTDGDGDPTTGPEPTVVVVTSGVVSVAKTTPSINVTRGQLVPYEITITNPLGVGIPDLGLVDRFPAGFHYVEGSARIEGVEVEPTIDGRDLTWANLGIGSTSRRSLRLLLAVGAGVTEGEYVNRAQAVSSSTGVPLSGEATASVRVLPDPTFACSDVMGKVFDDANRNAVQDAGERGLPGVRLVTARGLVATTDAYGRYHITCAIAPSDARGSNFVLKLDDRTLPSGYRASTRKLQVQRATSGKALRFNYAASIHRVVSLDMADAVFEPGSTEMRPQWRPRIARLLDELEKAPATLRLAYLADVEDARLVERRLAAVKKEIAEAWEALDGYQLTIEAELYWRRGAPVDRPPAGMPENR
jgi:uncharacterized repeat protein (TIGR01451 family)